ncbi:MAG TPA: metallopeptidase TldD-related protein [Bryobacteraceae bacterium]|nr:metallopeptidase TldD-related protein [Bryobacteraceae bacterium]
MLRNLPLLVLCLPLAAASPPGLLDILRDELQRNYSILKQKADPPPYYMSYTVTEAETELVATSFGAVTSRSKGKARLLDITIRVGSPKLDNYHITSGQRARFTSGSALPLDNVPDAIRRKVWLETDRTYRLAARRLIEIKSNAQSKVKPEDDSDDFSSEPPSIHEESPARLRAPDEEWTNRLKKWSVDLAGNYGVLNSGLVLAVQSQNKYMVSTEGTRLLDGHTTTELSIRAQGKASDGMDLSTFESFQGRDISRLPKPEVIDAAVNRVGSDLAKLLRAPTVEPFIGPAILSGRAAGVFFHEIFGHRVEGHRQKDEGEGQTFTKSVGTPVLPDFLSVVFDPTRKSIENIDLNGYYSYDDEGVKAAPVTVVEDGILKTFLMSRSPIHGFDHSNGHGRRQPGLEVVSRQSNLIVESKKKVPEKTLREMLLAEVKRQNKPYGLYFEQVTGGFTTTQRRGLQAYTVIPLIVYRVYPDGRPDELVRGVDIVGTPLASFAKILATSDKLDVFNGYCGAESGSVPVSASSPALLVSEIEIQKKDHSRDRPPLLSRPTETGGER